MFYPKTVSSITKSLQKIIDDLYTHANEKDVAEDNHNNKAYEHQAYAIAARAASDKATTIANNLKKLLEA